MFDPGIGYGLGGDAASHNNLERNPSWPIPVTEGVRYGVTDAQMHNHHRNNAWGHEQGGTADHHETNDSDWLKNMSYHGLTANR